MSNEQNAKAGASIDLDALTRVRRHLKVCERNDLNMVNCSADDVGRVIKAFDSLKANMAQLITDELAQQQRSEDRIAALEGALAPFAKVLPKDIHTQSHYFPADIGMMNGNVCQTVFHGLKVNDFWAAQDILVGTEAQSITVWKDGTWKRWRAADAHYSENESDWLCTIPLFAPPVVKTAAPQDTDKMPHPPWTCEKCGEEIGWLGRAREYLLGWIPGMRHRCVP